MFGGGLLALELGPNRDGVIGPVLQVADQRPDAVPRAWNASPRQGTAGKASSWPARRPAAKSATVASGAKPRSAASSSRMPQVSASRCRSGLSRKQKVEAASTPTRTGAACLVDLVEQADADPREVVPPVDPTGARDDAMDDVVHGALGDPIVEQVAEQLDHAAGRAMADQHQGQDQLPQPCLGDREVEEDSVGLGRGGERPVKGDLGGGDLLIDELPADLVLTSQLGDRFRPVRARMASSCLCCGRSRLAGQEDGAGAGISSDCERRMQDVAWRSMPVFSMLCRGIESPTPTWRKRAF